MIVALVALGAVFVAAAITAKGITAHGISLPPIESTTRQVLLAALGLVVIGLGVKPAVFSDLPGVQSQTVPLSDIVPGDCFNYIAPYFPGAETVDPIEATTTVALVTCQQPHDANIFASYSVSQTGTAQSFYVGCKNEPLATPSGAHVYVLRLPPSSAYRAVCVMTYDSRTTGDVPVPQMTLI